MTDQEILDQIRAIHAEVLALESEEKALSVRRQQILEKLYELRKHAGCLVSSLIPRCIL